MMGVFNQRIASIIACTTYGCPPKVNRRRYATASCSSAGIRGPVITLSNPLGERFN